MIIPIPKTPRKEVSNYLIEYHNKNESYKGSLSLNNIHDILENIIEEIRSVKKIKNTDFDFSNRSIAYWINGERNISVRNLFVLLNKWKSVCSISMKEYNQLLDALYSKATLYGYNGSESKPLIKYITPREAYLFGYHLGDGYLNNENLISYSDASINQLRFINLLFNDRFDINGRIRKDNRFNMFNLSFDSKFLAIFLNRVIKIPRGKKGAIAVPKLIRDSPFEIKKFFCGGFIDADGGIGSHSLTVTQTSKQILVFIKEILDDLKIESVIRGPYGPYKGGINPEWKLQIDKKKELLKLKEEFICFHPNIIKRLRACSAVRKTRAASVSLL